MRKNDFRLTLLSLFACALFAGCDADESQDAAAEAASAHEDGESAHGGNGAQAGKQSPAQAGASAKPSAAGGSSAVAGSGGAKAAGGGAGGAGAAGTSGAAGAKAPAQNAPSQSPSTPPTTQKAAGGSAAPAAGSGGGAGPAPWDNVPVVPKSTAPSVELGIETVMMDVAYVAGVNGSVNPEPRPIIMFKDGWACRDINFVVKDLSAAEHKNMYPKDWLQWQVVDGKVALQKGSNWEKMYFQHKYPPNNIGLTFDNTFTYSSGVTLGNTTAFVKKTVTFSSDHKAVWGGEPADASHRGMYFIDDYTITFKWDDGSETRTSFVWSEKDAPAVYIDGAAFLDRS